MSGTRPLVKETNRPRETDRLRPVQAEPVGKPFLKNLRQAAYALGMSGSRSREGMMTALEVARSMEPLSLLPEE